MNKGLSKDVSGVPLGGTRYEKGKYGSVKRERSGL